MSVNGASAIASEPTYIAPSPKPMASGEPRRAPIKKSFSPANRKASAKAPRSRGNAAFTASTGEAPRFISSVTRCAMTSVSVSVENFAPLPSSSRRNSLKFSIMPLCTTAELFGGMRMRVVLGRPAVRRPAGVADADRAGERLEPELLLEILELALGAAPRQLAVFERGDARGIVAAIFQALERIDELRRRRFSADDSDNAAHPRGCFPQNGVQRRNPSARHLPLTVKAQAVHEGKNQISFRSVTRQSPQHGLIARMGLLFAERFQSAQA